MTQPTSVVVGPNIAKFLAPVLLFPLGLGVAIWALVGLGKVFYAATGMALAITVVSLAAMLITQRPRLVITPEGFTFHRLFGSLSRQWADIDGAFGIIKIGFIKAVAYRFTADYRARTGCKPKAELSGYDDAIIGAFQLSAEQLAELLNSQKGQHASPS